MSIYSIDLLDAVASSIRIDVVNNSIVRIVPLLDEAVNEEWITNKVRFCYDFFKFTKKFVSKSKNKFEIYFYKLIKKFFNFIEYVF